jgi:putative thiamine transport system permease protein
LIVPLAFNAQAFSDAVLHPQFWGGLKLSLFTGTLATVLSMVLAIAVVMGGRDRLMRQAGLFLAVPHLALAIGFGFLIAPSGLLARIIAVPLGWTTPPHWTTVQDPYGLALTAALVLKETPFLVWTLTSLLNRDDLRQLFGKQAKVTRSLGHGSLSLWINVLLPQLLPRIVWPLVAVFAYGCTVVDMALVIGPTQPPTLAQVLWSDLNSGQPDHNARGAAGILLLSFIILILLGVAWLITARGGLFKELQQNWHSGTRNWPKPLSVRLWGFWGLLHSVIGVFILAASISGLWPYPDLVPATFTISAWIKLAPSSVATSLVLAIATALVALAACLCWFESVSSKFDRIIFVACAIALCTPGIAIALGQYRLFLAFGITGTALAMFLAHLLPVAAYVFVMLAGPYRAYDRRWRLTANGLRASPINFLVNIKWPMLKSQLLSSAAVGFAVSMAQYLPAQLAGAGRFTTLPMEAVTLASGGNRAIVSTYAIVLTVLPLITFALAAWLGRPRFHHA